MARFLFVVPPLAGHVNPTIPVGRALLAQGHAVAWTGCASILRAILPADLELIPVDETEIRRVYDAWLERSQTVFGLDSFKFFFEEFMLPLARFMVPGVEAAVARFAPDVVVCDQQALAGSLVARRTGLPWTTSATTSAAVFNPLAQFPKVKEWMALKLAELQEDYGLLPVDSPELSPELVTIFSVRELLEQGGEGGAPLTLPGHFHFVGPSLRAEANVPDFPWHRLDPARRQVYLSLGTLNAERSTRFYGKVTEAFGGLPDLQLIVSASPAMFGEVPANFIVQKGVPQLALLERVDAVVFHGGHNTLCESLYHGLPLVVAPIKDDQPVIAGQVTRTGAGVRVHFDRVKAADLREAVRRVLDEPSFRASARRLQASLRASGGAREAARLLTEVASGHAPRAARQVAETTATPAPGL